MKDLTLLSEDEYCFKYRELSRAAVHEIFDALRRESTPPTALRKCFLESKNAPGGHDQYTVSVPSYGHSFEALWRLASIGTPARLLDFLWSCRDRVWPAVDWNQDADEQGFRMNVAHQRLVVPVHAALLDTTSRQLAESGTTVAYDVSEETVREVVEYLVAVDKDVRARVERINGAVFVSDLGFSDTVVELGCGIRVKRLQGKEKSYHLNRNAPSWIGELGLNMFPSDYLLEIEAVVPSAKLRDSADRMAALTEPIVDRINLVKWALMLATETKSPLDEGTVVIRTQPHLASTAIHRGPVSPAAYVRMTNFSLREEHARSTRELVDAFLVRTGESELWWSPMWHFGRSCVAVSPRDSLLEAAIGMDSLLSTSGTNAGYKFELHGGVLLQAAGLPGEDVFKSMKKVYEWRSRSVHGHAGRVELERADNARWFMANVLLGLLRCAENGELRTSPAGESFAPLVQELVKRRALHPLSIAQSS